MKKNFPPAHLEAKTPEELRLVMMATNIKHKRNFHFFDFSFAQGKWHCWYEISTQELVGIKKDEER